MAPTTQDYAKLTAAIFFCFTFSVVSKKGTGPLSWIKRKIVDDIPA